MARPNKMWFKKSHNAWYATIGGRQRRLAKDEVEAQKKYHELMLLNLEPTKLEADTISVADASTLFLNHCQKTKSNGTHKTYKQRLDQFCAKHGNVLFAKVEPLAVLTFAANLGGKSPTNKRNSVIVIKIMCRWFSNLKGIIDPLRHLDKKDFPARHREVFLSRDEVNRLLNLIDDDSFRSLVRCTYLTGCRPQEIVQVEKRHISTDGKTWMFPVNESKGKRKARVIYLPKEVRELSATLAKENPTGTLFRTISGKPWNGSRTKYAFGRLQRLEAHSKMKSLDVAPKQRLTKKDLKKYAPTKYCLYTFRHSFASNAIEQGIDLTLLAKLMGHSSTNMIFLIYGHLEQKKELFGNWVEKLATADFENALAGT